MCCVFGNDLEVSQSILKVASVIQNQDGSAALLPFEISYIFKILISLQ